eukprot:6477665-Amphidinium_carterae.1
MSEQLNPRLNKVRVRARSSRDRLYGFRPYPIESTGVQVTQGILDTGFEPVRNATTEEREDQDIGRIMMELGEVDVDMSRDQELIDT